MKRVVELRPLHASFGAQVVGVDLARDLDEETIAAIQDAWIRYSLLLFREVRMTPAQHVAFTRRLGPLHVMEPLEFNLPEWPEVFVVSNVEEDGKPVGLKRAGWGWHSDGEDKAIPNAGSFLYALEVPPEGGDTLFADTYAAFAALPEAVRRVIEEPARVLQPGPPAPRPLPSHGAPDRRAEGQAPRRVASHRARAPAIGLDRALHRPVGLRGRGVAGSRGA